MPISSRLRALCLLPCSAALAGCNTVVLQPAGDVAAQQGQLVIISTLLMLLIIVPVIVLTLMFAWRYRQSNTSAPYSPDWDHSIQLELVIWAAPLLIIIALGALTWITTHTLDPYRTLSRIDGGRPIPRDTKPLTVEVVALDWKWLFIYPELGVATVNELAAPVEMPLRFKITSSSVMNSFYVPALAGQIYAMPGMETRLHAVANRPGVYEGFSANYSGAGFSDMHFKFHVMSPADFERWVQAAKSGGGELTRADLLKLEAPSEREPARRYGAVAPGLYDAVVNRCVEPGKTCLRQMMAIDERRQLQSSGWRDTAASTGSTLAQVCTVDDPEGTGRVTGR
jgi:cytochrome o ubiquinol oxidase subunit 2